MRNTFLWAVGATLCWTALARAQVLPQGQGAELLPPKVMGRAALRAQLLPPVTEAEGVSREPPAQINSADGTADSPRTSAPVFPADPCTPPDPCCCLNDRCASYPAFWASADYLLWFVKSGGVNGPLVTTGSPADPVPGALGQPNTQVLFGNSLNYNPLSGARFNVGVGLTPNIGLEAGYFLLERGAVGFTASSDATGSPLIARPYFDTFLNMPNAAMTSLPGVFAGSTTIESHSRLQGYEVNLAGNVVRNGRLVLDALAGFRGLDLNEDLSIQDTILPPGSANLNFGNTNVPANSVLADYDKFRATNHFFGGQLGARLQWLYGRFSVGMAAKVALGATQQLATIDGATAVLTPGQMTAVLPGGLLAQTSNIGRFYRDEFTVVPEAQLNFGWQVRSWMRLSIGYTFLYWSDVLRPGTQIDHNVNGSLIPAGQSFGLGNTAGPPFFAFHGSDFWAQGISFGALFNY